MENTNSCPIIVVISSIIQRNIADRYSLSDLGLFQKEREMSLFRSTPYVENL